MTSPPIPSTGRVLAVDWGTSRIGLAISDEIQMLATPLGTLRRRAGKRLPLRDFLTIIETEHPVGLVVGIPYDDFGVEGASAAHARVMGELFGARSALPVEWIDESFSTVEAHDTMIDTGRTRARRQHEIDAMAAAVALRRWLDRRRTGDPR